MAMRIERGKILKGVGGLYTVAAESGCYMCQARGLFRKQKITPLVGDIVDIQIIDADKRDGYLHEIHARRNELIRPKSANIDMALVVFAAAQPAIRLDLLDSFLISCARQNVRAAVCINKMDIQSAESIDSLVAEYGKAGYPVLCVSATEKCGLTALREFINGQTVIFAGPSGVGKSSLINALLPEACMETGELSKKLARGKHTTRHTELLDAGNDTFILDSPGFTSLTLDDIGIEALQAFFPEIAACAGECFYGDCVHVSEPDCAVRARVGAEIGVGRYERYVALLTRLNDARL